MLQENCHEPKAMPSSRVIRIDTEVWAELQRRAVPFTDNPNSVLRRVLGLRPNDVVNPYGPTGDGGIDPRVVKLLQMVEGRVGQAPVASPTQTGKSHRFRSNRGKVVALIHPQKRRLKIESSEQIARELGIITWDHWLKNGWWGEDNSVYWHTPNDDDDAYIRAANILEKLWRL